MELSTMLALNEAALIWALWQMETFLSANTPTQRLVGMLLGKFSSLSFTVQQMGGMDPFLAWKTEERKVS